MTKINENFANRISHFEAKYKQLNSQYNFWATLRIALFIITLCLIVFFANDRNGIGLWLTIMVFPIIFGLLVKVHRKIAYRRDHTKYLRDINENEVSIARHNFEGIDGGVEYNNISHPYSNDLDLFGASSIFQLLNRTGTKGGRDLLANWMLESADPHEIANRQAAVKELSDNLDWRQDLQATTYHYTRQKSDPAPLLDWMTQHEPVDSIYKIAAWVLPIVLIASIIANILTPWPSVITVILAVVNGVVLNRFQERVKELWLRISDHISMLGAYADLLEKIEHSNFQSQRLIEIKEAVVQNGSTASASIKKLYKILDFLNARSNFFYMMIDITFLFDIHIINMAEKWKSDNEANARQWFSAISELEALCSLAAFSYSDKSMHFPSIDNHVTKIEGKEIGHPLISRNQRVNNDFKMSEKGSVTIITGSNMSGKSTFLRTLGVNTVLALMGAPVCANEFMISDIQLFTSMRTQDNLEEHVSSFYAELQRIRQLLDLVKQPKTVFYMLDEILKGTNSQDRNIGAVSLAKQLSKTNSLGLISTHDLALGELANEMPAVVNYSFNSDIVDDKINFPYTLENGVCRSFNASKLMELIGIEIEKGS